MNGTTDLIKDLDVAVAGEGTATDLAEKYPDASDSDIETAKQIERTTQRLKHLLEQLQERDRRRKAMVTKAAEDAVADLKRRTAALAVGAGVATDREKELAKEAANGDDPAGLDDLAQSLETTTQHHANQ